MSRSSCSKATIDIEDSAMFAGNRSNKHLKLVTPGGMFTGEQLSSSVSSTTRN